MLQALCQLAREEDLLGDDPDFEMKPVAWIVHLTEDGRLLDIIPTHYTPPAEEGSKKKPKEEVGKLLVPRQPGRSGRKAPAYFLVDNAKYVFGLPTADKPFPPEEGADKSAWFRQSVRECAQATGDPAICTVLKFLDSVAAEGLPKPLPERCKSNELFAFRVEPEFESSIHLRPAIRQYWNTKCAIAGDEPQSLQCLVTGQPMGEPGLVPLIKKLPGASTAGAAVVSFNAGAFESYGWSGNHNAPISKTAAVQAATALNRLLDPAFKHPTSGETLPERRFTIAADTVACFWAVSAAGSEFCDHFAAAWAADDPAKVGELYASVKRGARPLAVDDSRFYAVTLSGAQGRVIVRDWFELTLIEAQQNIRQHFSDLEIVTNTRPAKDKSLPPVFSLRVLMESLSPGGKGELVPPSLAAGFFRAGVTGIPYPQAILAKAIERTRAEIGRDEWLDSYRRDARAALIKAVLNRLRRQPSSNCQFAEIQTTMDPTNHAQGYLLGRLLAVIERLQQGALGDVNANVIDRYFAAASATPLSVFTRLEKAVPHYVKKMRESDNELDSKSAVYLDRLRSALAFPFKSGYPSHLPLQQQGIFILGYHHQRHWLWLSKEKKQAWIDERGIDVDSVNTIL